MFKYVLAGSSGLIVAEISMDAGVAYVCLLLVKGTAWNVSGVNVKNEA